MPASKLAIAAIVALCAVGISFWATRQPAAPASTFILLDGSQKKLQDLRGQVTLINFWATSCVTCVREMPDLVATYQKYHPQGFNTIAVAMEYDQPAYVLNYAQTRQLPFDVAIDNTGAIAQAWGPVQLTPTTFLINKRGAIVKQFVGTPDFAELHRLIESLLKEA